MDLTIEMNDYTLCYQRVPMSYIHVFLTNKFSESIECCVDYLLSKNDVEELIEFLKLKDFGYCAEKTFVIDQLSILFNKMESEDKAIFRFW